METLLDWDWDWDLDLGLGTDASQVVTERVELVDVGEQALSGLVLVLAAKGMTAAVRTVGFRGAPAGKAPWKRMSISHFPFPFWPLPIPPWSVCQTLHGVTSAEA